MTNILTPRFQLTFLAAILFQVLQPTAMPTITSAAEQEVPRRHSLIHRSAGEPADLTATIQGTILQPSKADAPGITSPTAPSKNSVPLPPRPLPNHRTLTKRPAIASTTAPATSSHTADTAVTSAFAARQVTQTTTDTTKGTTPTTIAPVAKSVFTPLAGITSTGSAAAAQTAHSSSVAGTGVHPVASTGSGSSSPSSGSRSAANLLQNSAVANLLQPPAPVVTPPSTPPSSPPPPSSSTESVTLTWTANGEPDLAGYKIYVGMASGVYNFPGSAFYIGKVTSYTISNLPKGQTYFFAMSAYDNAGNESGLSGEVSKSIF